MREEGSLREEKGIALKLNIEHKSRVPGKGVGHPILIALVTYLRIASWKHLPISQETVILHYPSYSKSFIYIRKDGLIQDKACINKI